MLQKMIKIQRIGMLVSISLIFLAFTGCDEKKELPGVSTQTMKCGAGKCGANMFTGNSTIEKNKRNLLSQMQVNDPRKKCVISAKTTKEAHNCVRDPNTNKLILIH